MKVKLMALLITLCFALSLSSCFVTSRDTHVNLSYDEFSANPTSIRNDFTLQVGDKLYIELCSNPSTGFKWSYTENISDIVKVEGYDYQEAEPDTVGAYGKETWTFEGAKAGTTTISMEYSQPWEGGTKREWTYTVNVKVK